jgi:DNA invertase Pin-like site-specific DNA recombinase
VTDRAIRVGYARCSTEEQSLDIQREQLEAAGCRRIFEEKVSGKSRDGRGELEAALRFLELGDTLVVTKLDRLARSTIDMLTIITELAKRGVKFTSLVEPWANTDSPAAELLLTMMAGVAQFERGRIRERQAEGIAKAKTAGKYRGRKRKVNVDDVLRLKAQGLGATAIAKQLGCKRQSVYRVLKEADPGNVVPIRNETA